MREYFNFFKWIKNYNKSLLRDDLSAGITVEVLLIPQGMAYAMVAGLPPVYGLYASVAPQIMYALLGSNPKLSVGPVAMDSLLVAITINTMSAVDEDHYISLAIFTAFLVGLLKIIGKRNFFSSLDIALKHIKGHEIPKIEKRISNQHNNH